MGSPARWVPLSGEPGKAPLHAQPSNKCEESTYRSTDEAEDGRSQEDHRPRKNSGTGDPVAKGWRLSLLYGRRLQDEDPASRYIHTDGRLKLNKMNRQLFFHEINQTLFHGKMNDSQQDGIVHKLKAFDKFGITDNRWQAYMLATSYHETAKTMQPVEEIGKGRGKTEMQPQTLHMARQALLRKRRRATHLVRELRENGNTPQPAPLGTLRIGARARDICPNTG